MANKDNSKYVVAYDKEAYEQDEASFQRAINSEKINELNLTEFKRLMIHDICKNSSIIETGHIGDIKLEDIHHALKCPSKRWRTILRASEYLMRTSPHYYRLNNLYGNMALFNWGVDLCVPDRSKVKVDVIENKYSSLAVKLENMQLKHEFGKIMKYLPYQDIYCGLVYESTTDFFFYKVNLDICEIHQVQDGLYNFKINLSAIKAKEFDSYPDYVQQAYMDYIEGKSDSMWYSPPADKQICIKFNSQWTYPCPVLISIIKDVLDLDTYKKLKLQSARTDNYKAIMVKVPIDESTVDKPLLTPETLGIFAEINRESMSDDIGLIHTLGSAGEAISFKDSTNTTNNVSDAVDEIYNSSGASQELFNGSSSGTAVTFSVENDSGFVYHVYRQFERWMDRFFKLRKYNKPTFWFHFYILDSTIFNKDNVIKKYSDACTLGLPVIDKLLAALDMTPSRVFGADILHNDIFDFYNKFRPLSSSYNSSSSEINGSKEPGRPTNESKGETLDVEGEKTADGDKNDR